MIVVKMQCYNPVFVLYVVNYGNENVDVFI